MGMEANSTCTGLMLDKDRCRPPSQNRSFAVPEVGLVAQPDRASAFEAEVAGSRPAAVASKEKPCLAEQAGSKSDLVSFGPLTSGQIAEPVWGLIEAFANHCAHAHL